MFGSKRFKSNPVLDHELHPIPKDLKNTMDLISKEFNNSRLMSLDLINTEGRLFGFITSYIGSNFCWIQPTKTRTKESLVEYHKYIKTINSLTDDDYRYEGWLSTARVGGHCIARYEVDRRWYRAVIVGEPVDDKWLVQFVDYGNYQRCDLTQIREPISKPGNDHFDVPLQAVCCRLYNIVPKLPEYRDEIDVKLENFYANNCMEYLEIVVRNVRPDYVVDCDVFRAKRHGPQDFYRKHIGQEVVDLGLATFADPNAAHTLKPTPIECINIEEEVKYEEEDIKPKIETPKQEKHSENNSKPLYKYQTVSFF